MHHRGKLNYKSMQNFKRLLQMQDWSTENHTTTKTTNQLFLVMVTVATREVMEGFLWDQMQQK